MVVQIRGLKLDPKPFPGKNEADGYRLDTVEKWAMTRALHKCNGHVRTAAKLLGVGHATLYRKILKYGLRA